MVDQDYLAHHGVLGMKWGVRKYTDAHGNRVRKAGIGTAARVRQKQGVFERKIQKHDDNIIMRNTVNDWRRGRIAQLERKAQHREAKNAYKKHPTKSNLTDKKLTAYSRLSRNGLGPALVSKVISPDALTISEGSYNRYRKNGDTRAKALLKSSGKIAVGVVAARMAAKAGRKMIMQAMADQYGFSI